MGIESIQPPRSEAPRITRKLIGANIIYLLLVHVWALGLPALGRDLLLYSAPDALPLLVQQVFKAEMFLFGEGAFLYQILNLALLWGCMICVFFLTRFAVRGPWWLGSLSATLLMANPVKTEAVLFHSGIADLLPALLALLSLSLYAWHAGEPRLWRWGLCFLFFALASFFDRNLLLFGVFVLYEALLVPAHARRFARLLPMALVFILALTAHLTPADLSWPALDPIRSFLPLYLILYPIGFLPQTMHRIMEEPHWFWLSAAALAAILVLIHRKARHPALLFAIGSMLLLRLFQGDRFIDPVSMAGGGALLLPAAIFYIALAALLRQMICHPKWVKPMITATTLGAMFFMGLQVYFIFQWRAGAAEVQAFRENARAWVRTHPNDQAIIAPDYRYRATAPLWFGEAFAAEVGEDRLAWRAPLNAAEGMRVAVSRSAEGLDMEVEGVAPYAAAGWPYTLEEPGEEQRFIGGVYVLDRVEADRAVLQAVPDQVIEEAVLLVPKAPSE